MTVTESGTATHGEGLTVHHGLHDALRILTVVAVVLLVAAAALLPVALAIAALAFARRGWLRRRREQALAAQR